jgi:hypothetical protein
MSDPVQAARAAADAIDAQALGGAMLVSNDLLNEWAKLLRSLADAVARLTRERDALRAVLAPFAEAGRLYQESMPDAGRVANWWPLDNDEFTPTVGDCRRAAEALARPADDAGGGRG